uniref:Laminin G domain-containing protein n=1 Tax=Timema douglasi TaxID=61478 RepID=A0A7R8VR40_TIMDO|nr:unnamed protein product [Timema douglasi]
MISPHSASSLSSPLTKICEHGPGYIVHIVCTAHSLVCRQLRGGRLTYVSHQGTTRTPVNMTVNEGEPLADGQWHNLTLHSHPARGLRLYLDSVRVGDVLDLAGVHDFLDPYLTALSVGGAKRDTTDSATAGQSLHAFIDHFELLLKALSVVFQLLKALSVVFQVLKALSVVFQLLKALSVVFQGLKALSVVFQLLKALSVVSQLLKALSVVFQVLNALSVVFQVLKALSVVFQGFEGCLANLTVNHEVQPFNGSGTIFSQTTQHGKVVQGCQGSLGLGEVESGALRKVGIMLVIVFFVCLLIGLLIIAVFRLRKQSKEKKAGHTKQNGGATLVTGGGLASSGIEGGVLGRNLHSGEGVNVGFHPDNGDVMRGVTAGHHLVGPELISKKYKEREIVSSEPRPQRPDIIEREVVNKSIPMREDQPPPLPPPNPPPPGTNDLDIPEHYDLENASSIAPSDIDIVFHYKGYREGANVRKYKAAPPHLPPPSSGYHHKHQPTATQSQHRHSPHGYSPRTVVPPPPVSRVDSPPSAANTQSSNNPKLALQHQSTPLARLSPSSELSSQQAPRILTLQDISGKPLQSALLATTSSSGGKDALHSNSERSLNSPVMSQLSGQSSSAGRKTPGDPTTTSMGLTAEEIDRLNSRPRTSSLVSTLDAVSSSSEAPRARGRLLEPGGVATASLHHLHHGGVNGVVDLPDTHLDNNSSTTTDESGNDSFTCSEFEYDNDKRGDETVVGTTGNTNNNNNNNKPPLPPVPVAYDGFDSSFRGSFSTLVASDDDLSTHMGAPMYRPHNGSPSSTAALGWDYLLNWGPNFESLVGVFKDIAELPDSVSPRGVSSLRLPNSAVKPSEEYV